MSHRWSPVAVIARPNMIGVEFAAAGHTLGRPLGIELSFDQLYERDERLRSGSFGTVYSCHRRTHPETTYGTSFGAGRVLLLLLSHLSASRQDPGSREAQEEGRRRCLSGGIHPQQDRTLERAFLL